MTDVDPAEARRLWQLLEPVHAVVYFAPEVGEAMRAVDLKGFWMGYFAGRAAPLGPVGPDVVTAVFFGFHPSMVAQALPDAWTHAEPAEVLAARTAAVGVALERLLGPDVDSRELRAAADLARAAADACDVAGRPLFAAHRSLPWPKEPHLVLWHAATLLREHRGDGHVVSLAAEGLDGCSAHVAAVETGAVPRDALQPNRGWTDDEWEAARSRLAGIDLADLRMRIEIRTDRLAVVPWSRVGAEHVERLAALLAPIAQRVMDAGAVPVPNPMGLPWPPTPLS